MFWQKSYRLEWYLIIWHYLNLYVYSISFIARHFLLWKLTGAKFNFETMFQQERNRRLFYHKGPALSYCLAILQRGFHFCIFGPMKYSSHASHDRDYFKPGKRPDVWEGVGVIYYTSVVKYANYGHLILFVAQNTLFIETWACVTRSISLILLLKLKISIQSNFEQYINTHDNYKSQTDV